MREIAFLQGSNFSGRSDSLRQWLTTDLAASPVVFVGPTFASALTGLAATVTGERILYEAWKAVPPPTVWQDYFAPRSKQLITSLSGGEQILLALAATARADVTKVAIDTALEQLDTRWRAWALSYLRSAAPRGVVRLTDNRLPPVSDTYDAVLPFIIGASPFPLQFEPLASIRPAEIPGAIIIIDNLSFRYKKGPVVFRDSSFKLLPGHIYRLCGSTGAGKSTLIRLLCGVLPFHSGQMLLNGRPYTPYREGNRLLALSTQNPDDQWTDVTIAGDLQRRLRHLSASNHQRALPADALVAKWETMLGLHGHLHRHVLDSPRVLRKRYSWIWPLTGRLPWLVFDEPTLGQDNATVAQFAAVLGSYTRNGYGVLYVSHDERLPDTLPSTDILVADAQVIQCR